MNGTATSIRKFVYNTLAKINNGKPKAVIICYHSISNGNWQHSISLDIFKKQVEYLLQNYKPTTLDEIKEYIDGKAFSDNTPRFAITFDDGYKDVLQVNTYLTERSIKPTIFLLSKPEQANKYELKNEEEFLSKADVLSLIQNGWEIGSHGECHRDFWKLNEDEIKSEIEVSKKTLESVYGVKVKYFSYPRGRYTEQIVNEVEKAGYEGALTMDDGIIGKDTNIYLLPKVAIDKTHTFEEFTETILESVILCRKFIKNFAGGILRNYL